ncbi:unnamed protein product [Allacma fusca]|uniref:Sodefrin-like factor n=1 Tax=Allacma fusca TaxID=39272 RepID=A0A8J2PF05_9HEXA|nr:unnamed protein product [Allacma fusca]
MLLRNLLSLFVFSIWEFQPAFGLKCYSCRYWEGSTTGEDPSCLLRPKSSDLRDISDKDSQGQDYCCATEIITIKGYREIIRRYVSSHKNLTGMSEEGSIAGTDNPEKNYIRYHFCKSDGCNTHPHVDPPSVPSSIKCFMCDDDKDANCKTDVPNEYLIAADPIPSWAREPYKGYTGRSANDSVRFNTTLSIGAFQYKTYCKTTSRNSTSGTSISRGVSWFKISDGDKNGKCERPNTDVEYCYCNDTNGCNNNNSYRGAAGMTKSCFIFLTLALIVLFIE